MCFPDLIYLEPTLAACMQLNISVILSAYGLAISFSAAARSGQTFGVSGPPWKKSCLEPHIKYTNTNENWGAPEKVLGIFTVLCWATFRPTLSHMQPAGTGWTPLKLVKGQKLKASHPNHWGPATTNASLSEVAVMSPFDVVTHITRRALNSYCANYTFMVLERCLIYCNVSL